MSRLIGWTAIILLTGVLIWYTTADVPLWSKVVAGVVLVATGLVAGLRIGTHSAKAYLHDVQRLNKVLADQNEELTKANAVLLKELGADAKLTRRSESV